MSVAVRQYAIRQQCAATDHVLNQLGWILVENCHCLPSSSWMQLVLTSAFTGTCELNVSPLTLCVIRQQTTWRFALILQGSSRQNNRCFEWLRNTKRR